MSMSSSEYSQYRAAIEAANDSQDREALRQIQKQLIAKYGADDRDVYYLLKMFRYNDYDIILIDFMMPALDGFSSFK